MTFQGPSSRQILIHILTDVSQGTYLIHHATHRVNSSHAAEGGMAGFDTSSELHIFKALKNRRYLPFHDNLAWHLTDQLTLEPWFVESAFEMLLLDRNYVIRSNPICPLKQKARTTQTACALLFILLVTHWQRLVLASRCIIVWKCIIIKENLYERAHRYVEVYTKMPTD